MNKIITPKVKVSDALALAGNQNKLAKMLGIHRVSVNAWVTSGREFLPDLQATRIALVHPEIAENNHS